MLNDGLKTCNSAEWATPQDFFDRLDDEFHFTLDPCSTDENAKCEKHYTKEQDGLAQDWTGETVFCNPPYGREIWKWCRKCYLHATGGGYSGYAHSREDGHGMVSRMGIRKSGDSVRPWAASLWRKQMECPVSVPCGDI